jgi:hypothetical protein
MNRVLNAYGNFLARVGWVSPAAPQRNNFLRFPAADLVAKQTGPIHDTAIPIIVLSDETMSPGAVRSLMR